MAVSCVLGFAGFVAFGWAEQNPSPTTSAPIDVEGLIVAIGLLILSVVCLWVSIMATRSSSQGGE